MTLEDMKQTLSPLTTVKMNDTQRNHVEATLRRRMVEVSNKPVRRSVAIWEGAVGLAGLCAAILLAVNLDPLSPRTTNLDVAKPAHTYTYHKVASLGVPLDSLAFTNDHNGWGLSTYGMPGKNPTILYTNNGGAA